MCFLCIAAREAHRNFLALPTWKAYETLVFFLHIPAREARRDFWGVLDQFSTFRDIVHVPCPALIKGKTFSKNYFYCVPWPPEC